MSFCEHDVPGVFGRHGYDTYRFYNIAYSFVGYGTILVPHKMDNKGRFVFLFFSLTLHSWSIIGKTIEIKPLNVLKYVNKSVEYTEKPCAFQMIVFILNS